MGSTLHSRPKHVGPNILPKFPIFTRLVGYASREELIAINDVTNGFAATHLQLLTDVLHLRNVLYDSLDEKTQQRLWDGEEVFFNLLAPGGYEFATGFLAILAIGGVIVPLSPALPVQEATYFVKKSEAVTVLTSQRCMKLGNALAKEISSDFNPRFHSIDIRPHLFRPTLEPSDIIVSSDHFLDYYGSGLVIFTSGTTGPPKGAVKRRSFLDSSAQMMADLYNLGPDDTVMHNLPVHHATGISTTFAPFLQSGSCIEFHSSGFDPANVWERWRRGGLTLFSGVPTMYMRLMRYFETNICKLPTHEMEEYIAAARNFKGLLCGTSALPFSLQQKWSALLGGKKILERYGTTEFSGAFTVQPGDTNCPDGSVGKVMPGLEIQLSDGDEGEILIKSPFMFSRYLHEPEATTASFREDGFFKTGDIARRVGPYYFIMGRASIDIIKSGGYKISALDIEREILGLDYTLEAMVVGVEDEEFGQRVAAAIVLKDRESLTLDALRQDLRSRLAGYKMPTLLRVVPELPKTVSGKVIKKKLRTELFPAEGHPDVQFLKSIDLISKSIFLIVVNIGNIMVYKSLVRKGVQEKAPAPHAATTTTTTTITTTTLKGPPFAS
ncbi:hypothetical protein B7463_g5091, partial [Scytalidium lignicola]